MVNYCCVYNCKSNSRDNPKFKFFMIPSDPMRPIVWLPLIGKDEYILQDPKVVCKKRICSLHFSEDMISGSKLKRDAQPNVFLDGVGFKAVNQNASTSISVPSTQKMVDDTQDTITNICRISDQVPEETQTSPRLSACNLR